MPVNKSFIKRLLIIHDCLANRKQKVWTKESLIEEISRKLFLEEGFGRRTKMANTISESTFYNDIRELRQQYKAPLVCRNGQYRYTADFHPTFHQLTQEAQRELVRAVNILKGLESSVAFDNFRIVSDELEAILKAGGVRGSQVVSFEHHPPQQGMREYFGIIFDAIISQSELDITYQRFSDLGSKEFILFPYLMKEYRNRWYLVGRLKSKGELITLSLDRIKDVKVRYGQAFEMDAFDPVGYFAHTIGISVGNQQKPENIKIRVHATQVPYFDTQPLHTSQQKERTYSNGDALFSYHLIINIDLKLAIMQLADKLEVMAPKSLRAELHGMLLKGLRNNKI